MLHYLLEYYILNQECMENMVAAIYAHYICMPNILLSVLCNIAPKGHQAHNHPLTCKTNWYPIVSSGLFILSLDSEERKGASVSVPCGRSNGQSQM